MTYLSRAQVPKHYMSYSLNSLRGVYIRDYIGDYYRGVIKGMLGVWTITHMTYLSLSRVQYLLGGPYNKDHRFLAVYMSTKNHKSWTFCVRPCSV